MCSMSRAVRASSRLVGHFQERHYRTIDSDRPDECRRIGDRPLSWWAVKRVMEYSGRLNIWLAGGFGILYASYIVAGDAWPVWLSRQVFGVVDQSTFFVARSTMRTSPFMPSIM